MRIVAALLFLGLLIFIHELGHFAVAKSLGIGVRVLSLGFGRRLLGFRKGETDYRISLIPFGGYVRMHGGDPFQAAAEEDEIPLPEERSIASRPVWQRILVSAGGPVFNLVLPFFIFMGLYMAGQPETATVAGTIVQASAAQQAGLLPGDRIVSVQGRSVETWEEMSRAFSLLSPDVSSVDLAIERASQALSVSLGQPRKPKEGRGLLPEDFGIRAETPDTEIGVDDPSSPAALAGLRTGDRLVEIGGIVVEDWLAVERALQAFPQGAELVFKREGAEQRTRLKRELSELPDDTIPAPSAAQEWGFASATLFVEAVSKDSPSKLAGVEPGDHILAIDEKLVSSWHEVLRAIEATAVDLQEGANATPVSLKLRRAGETLDLTLQPVTIRDTDYMGRYYRRPIIGIVRMGGWADGALVRKHYGVVDASSKAGRETVGLVRATVEQIGRILLGQVAPQESIGGPVEIMRQASEAAEEGWFYIVRLLGMISISVGIFNLLPVPLLDGGTLFFLAIEAIRGRAVSATFREKAQIVGFMLLVALMLFVLVMDVGRLFKGG